MGAQPDENVTMLIDASRRGDADARNRLFQLVYDDLRRLARANRFVGRQGETMQPTALVNEVFLHFQKMLPVGPAVPRESREEFFRAVALAMRSILRDHWRKKTARKRGGGDRPVGLGEIDAAAPAEMSGEFASIDFLALDEALTRLEQYNNRWYEVVLHRYFAGRSAPETAEMMGVGLTTVKSDWQLARAWLRRELEAENHER